MKFNFQFVIITIFMLAAIFGILVFSGAIPIGEGGQGTGGTAVLWGTVPSALIAEALESFNNANEAFSVRYVQKSAATFDRELLEALASGEGPDLFFLPDNLAYHYANKLYAIPYQSFPEATFKNTFTAAGEVFATRQGILAFPITVDPLMLYYNRSMLDSAGIVAPPKDWEEFSLQVLKLTEKDETGRITRSGAALGQYANVTHAKDILNALFMQGGNPVTRQEDGKFVSTLDMAVGGYDMSSILQFYASFADPGNPLYSWNRSFADSADAFSNEDVAFYFGYASELETLANRNPNHNFFVAPVPQIKGARSKATYARVTGIAVSSSSRNLNTALAAASLLSSTDFAASFAKSLGVAPARRDLLAQPPESAFLPVFYSSALFARGWLDPSPEDTDEIWAGMVGAVLSNSTTPYEAVRGASSKLGLLLIQ